MTRCNWSTSFTASPLTRSKLPVPRISGGTSSAAAVIPLKTFDVLVELQHSLNFERGGEIARNYARLYDYCQRRALEGHTAASEACFAEVASLLGDMKEAWQAVIKHNAANRRVVDADPTSAYSTTGAQAGSEEEAASVREVRFA